MSTAFPTKSSNSGVPEVFKYPFAYISEPGKMELSDQEIVNLREYIDRGGFIMVDDLAARARVEANSNDFAPISCAPFPIATCFC